MIIASPRIQSYFDTLTAEITRTHDHAKKARAQQKDPDNTVEIQLAKNMAERVVGLISVLAPQIVGSGVVERIIELEKQYGALNWRVALQIAVEIAQQKFCTFQTKEEAIDIGIRTGFAYSTVGVVSSPLDGIVSIEFKKRNDGRGTYLCINYGGPIRNAGGTNAALSVIIADHVRNVLGYDVYDATPEEIKRAFTELTDYHERVTNLQYFPHEEEINFLMKNLPVEVSGDASEEIEVSNFKNLPRIPTNQIRSGFCLILSSCIPLKAPKLWKQLSQWGKEFGLSQWMFLEEFTLIQKKAKAKGLNLKEEKKDAKITPDYTYIADLVAGRPVLGFPLQKGGFRLRYGRSRASGLSGQSVHPATMHILDNYIATGTQLKVERPGKSATFTPCDLIEGPIVKLEDGSVVRLESESQAKTIKKQVVEILFLGDALIDYGDFANRNHVLAPAGYCEEWWALEAKKKLSDTTLQEVSEKTGIKTEQLNQFFESPLTVKPSIEQTIALSKNYCIPFHPAFTLHWADIEPEMLSALITYLSTGTWHFNNEIIEKIVLPNTPQKRILEIIGCPHIAPVKDTIVIEKEMAAAISFCLNINTKEKAKQLIQTIQTHTDKKTLEIINTISPTPVRDKSGTYIGSRMGRPEKAKMRKLIGSPHGLIPVGEEGGKLRSLLAAVQTGKVTAAFPLRYCTACQKETIYSTCECGNKPKEQMYCRFCGTIQEKPTCHIHGKNSKAKTLSIDIKQYFTNALKILGMTQYPDLIKGVRGTMSDDHDPEHVAKAILRAVHNVHVNKDGTIRYDCGELSLTHFKPVELGTSIEKLKQMGYTHDITGKPLTEANQILEIFPQDVVLPCCPDSPDEHADNFCLRVMHFVDDLLTKFYKMEPFYNCSTREHIIGQFIIGLAPHTSAGMVGRIIGFTKTQGFLAHPYFHQACRRDCDGDEIGFILLMDAFLNFSKKFLPSSRGATMDAPLVLTSILIPTEVDDQAFDVGTAWNYPLEFYNSTLVYKMPFEIKIPQIKNVLNTPQQYEGMGFTHDTTNINAGILCSAYKTLPSMEEKLKGQMQLAAKLRAVDKSVVAQLVIEKHFLKDTKGNMRKFSQQEFRCVNCNEKYRRPPLIGACTKCKGKIIFTVSEGNIIKYLEPIQSIARTYNVPAYLVQTIELLSRNIESYFGKEKEKQLGLGAWFG
ncbi:MAG: DNA polymerase II large subunit [Candidatus Aenigmarchaeota archaeon]|nr:DNA polymerase II large subunit [Candidatus Aenigmarchaeota archaeon]